VARVRSFEREGADHPVAKDSAIVAMECARLFVHHLAACTNDLAKQQNKSIIMPNLVIEAGLQRKTFV
jgi:hypothetical protein